MFCKYNPIHSPHADFVCIWATFSSISASFFFIQLKICVLLMCLAVDHNVLYDYVKLLMQEYIYFVSSFLFDNLGFSTVKANLILSVPQGHTCPTWKKGHNHNLVLCILFRKTKYSRSDKWFLKYVLAKCKKWENIFHEGWHSREKVNNTWDVEWGWKR